MNSKIESSNGHRWRCKISYERGIKIRKRERKGRRDEELERV